ncbi:PIN-like domain-containing protein [Streptomyces aidingensis]|uniref:PIN like domain-containing protein n=1 Tax=Streptomyces aidingensis TaxID=910347 RepID=A0A1I1VCQ4_9ACTN|nr:PIN domain-containing protein [Streptomyces aidingensis]SFD80871.1 hypothetical protein SAMN05421773_1342 [Streptomyces aidingensis]
MPPGQGLFDGFEAQRTPSDDDYKAVLQQGLVVLDTNVLLDLYRMNCRVREDMLTVLQTLAERLWIPQQVITEFWRNRQSEELIAYHDRKADTAKQALRDAFSRANRAIEEWTRNVHADSELAAPLREKLSGAERIFEELKDMLDSQAAEDSVFGIRNTNTDPVITELERLLDGRVGLPFCHKCYTKELDRAKDRASRQIPPGFLDFESGKKDDEAAGDYFVWRQLLDEAASQRTDVLFVTRDLKDDWWRKASPKAIRMPRVELVNELRDLTGRRLFMVEPSVLMRQVSRVFKLEKKFDRNSVAALQHLETASEAADEMRRSASDTRYGLAQVPGGRSGDYVETIWIMAQLAEENSQLSSCIEKFMEYFPSITLVPEARRRLMNLVNLGLAVVQREQIYLTEHGRKFTENRDAELLCRLFMERIKGAAEVRDMQRRGIDISEVKDLLAEHPDLELSATQSDLLIRWMGKLGLLTR